MNASVFDQTWQRERDRLRAFEDLFDPASRRQLAGRGIRPGWLDPRFLDRDGAANLEVRQHDIQADCGKGCVK
jgi:hypothetical protein